MSRTYLVRIADVSLPVLSMLAYSPSASHAFLQSIVHHGLVILQVPCSFHLLPALRYVRSPLRLELAGPLSASASRLAMLCATPVLIVHDSTSVEAPKQEATVANVDQEVFIIQERRSYQLLFGDGYSSPVRRFARISNRPRYP